MIDENRGMDMRFFMAYMPQTACCLTAGLVAYSGSSNWGWVLLAALWLGPSYSDLKLLTDEQHEKTKT